MLFECEICHVQRVKPFVEPRRKIQFASRCETCFSLQWNVQGAAVQISLPR